MDFVNIFVNSFQKYFVIWARITPVILLVPFFSSSLISLRLKLIFSTLLAFVFFPVVAKKLIFLPQTISLYYILLLREVLVGIIMGFFVNIIFNSFQLAAQFFSIQIGLGMANALDPMLEQQSPIFGYLFYLLGILVFISIKGHYMVITTIYDSFKLLPFSNIMSNSENLIQYAIKYFSLLFYFSLKMAFPILATMLIIITVLGLLGKIAPQTNIMIIGLPIELGVGLIIIMITLPYIIDNFGRLFDYTFKDIMFILDAVSKKGGS